MLNDSILIMTVGMGSVFVFLGILVVALQISARFFADWPLDEELQSLPKKTIPNAEQDDELLIAIALAAIKHQESQS